ncbi:MAG: hypothetical protein NC390_05665 [Fusobacterium sp.]|nr:hypothetical protein [Fusobacterium sp.]
MEKTENVPSLEDRLAEFKWRYKEVFNSFSILRDALSNDMNEITVNQIEDMIEILFERMEENTTLFDVIMDKFQESTHLCR